MSKKDWTEQLPEALSGYTEAEPEGLWDAVQAGLAAAAAPPVGAAAPRRRRVAAFWWWSVSAALAAACVAALVLLRPAARTESEVVTLAEVPSPSEGLVAVVSVEENVVVSVEEKVVVAAGESLEADEIPAGEASRAGSRLVAADTPQENNDSVFERVDPISETPGSEDSGDTDVDLFADDPIDIQPVKSPATRTTLSLGAFSGRLLAGGSSTTRGYGLPGTPMRMASGGGINPTMMARNKPSTTQARHSGGISYGITLMIQPWRNRTGWDRFGVETGLMLSPLESEITTEAGNVTVETSRKMRYLGVPLFLHYDVLRLGNAHPLSLYAVGGPMYEWSVRTHTETVRRIGDYVAEAVSDEDNIRSSFLSLHAALGLQWTFLPGRDRFTGGAFFLQGGLGCHFDPGTDLQNAYTEHPIAPTLTFGLRFGF